MDNYLSLSSWDDLSAAAGIRSLTGEACAYSLRLLCDVNEEGRELLQDFFGIPELKLAAPWNSTVNNQPSIGSVMLARAMLQPLAEFVLARKQALAVLYINNHVAGGIFDEKLLAEYELAAIETHEFRRLPQPSRSAAVGSRNVHQATGRVV